MFRLTGEIRPYGWGSTTAIADLLGREPSGGPEAELWLGAHPDSPSVVADGEPAAGTGLDTVIAEHPAAMLGTAVRERFGDRLPFLMKVLAADAPLSLQVHPTIEQARAGFAAEEADGVARDAADRNYRDENHKPEMILALTGFEALSGFRAPEQTARLLRTVIGTALETNRADGDDAADRERGVALLGELATILEQDADRSAGSPPSAPDDDHDDTGDGTDRRLRNAFALVFDRRDDAAAASEAVAGVDVAALPAAMRASVATAADLQQRYPGDPGVLVSLLLNRVSLAPGQAIYLPAGNVHAYLSGLGVEVMAASDNVLRGGLTSKHVDVPELMRTVRFAALGVPELPAVDTEWGQRVFAPPFDEFALQVLEFPAGTGDESTSGDVPVLQHGPVLVLVTHGGLVLDSPNGSVRVGRGETVFVPATESPVMARSAEPGTTAYAVTVARDL